jgi:hypothetical protein
MRRVFARQRGAPMACRGMPRSARGSGGGLEKSRAAASASSCGTGLVIFAAGAAARAA